MYYSQLCRRKHGIDTVQLISQSGNIMQFSWSLAPRNSPSSVRLQKHGNIGKVHREDKTNHSTTVDGSDLVPQSRACPQQCLSWLFTCQPPSFDLDGHPAVLYPIRLRFLRTGRNDTTSERISHDISSEPIGGNANDTIPPLWIHQEGKSQSGSEKPFVSRSLYTEL